MIKVIIIRFSFFYNLVTAVYSMMQFSLFTTQYLHDLHVIGFVLCLLVLIHIKEGSVRNVLQSVSKQKSRKITTTKGEVKETVCVIYS